MKQRFLVFFSFIILAFYTERSFSQTILSSVRDQSIETLPRSVPEVEGVSSESIINFLEAAGNSKH